MIFILFNLVEIDTRILNIKEKDKEYYIILGMNENRLEIIFIECLELTSNIYRILLDLEDLCNCSIDQNDNYYILSMIIEKFNKKQYTIKSEYDYIKLTLSKENSDFLKKKEFTLYKEKIHIKKILKFLFNKIGDLENLKNSNNNLNLKMQSSLLNGIYNKIESVELEKKNKFLRNQEELTINKLLSCNINNMLSDLSKFHRISKILFPEDLTLFKNWFNTKKLKIDLLYSSEIHGEDVNTFHKKCDGVNNTLVLFFSNYEKRFGGFSTIPWSCKRGYVEGKGDEFLFSLNYKKMFKNDKNLDKAIYNNPEYFPTFGSGCDLNIYKDCFEINNSYTYSNFQHSYGNKDNLGENNNSETYLAGSRKFRVIRMEVFKIYLEN